MRTTTLLLAALAAVAPSTALAHGLRTAHLELEETTPNVYAGRLKLTVIDDRVDFVAPSRCERTITGGGRAIRAFTLRCERGLEGETIVIAGLGPVISEAVVRVTSGGETHEKIFTPSAASWVVPAEPEIAAIAADYALLGVEHILEGLDHLLFVLALVLLVAIPRRIFAAVTAFTVAHSITLGAAVLGAIEVSNAAAEVCIALSLVLVALDLGREKEPSAWSAAGTAFTFGLVHGLGFAGALREIGFPDRALPLALASFNIGVELGQIAVVGALLLLLKLVPRSKVTSFATYNIGVAGTFWLFQRALALWA